MKKIILLVVVSVALTNPCSAATLFFDFGDSGQPTPGNYNNVPPAQDPIFNALDSAGNLTGIGLTTTGFNELGPNTNGTQTPGAPANVFDPQATRDNLFGHSDNFNAGSPRPTAVLTLSGLDGTGGTLYDFTFFGSRLGVSDNRETQFAVAGANNGIGYVDASGNTSSVANVTDVTPTAAGQIVITVSAGPNNNNGSRFYYLGAMRVDSTPVPEPSTLALASLVGVLAVIRRRCR